MHAFLKLIYIKYRAPPFTYTRTGDEIYNNGDKQAAMIEFELMHNESKLHSLK